MINDVVLLIGQCLEGDAGAWRFFVKEFSSVAKNIIGASSQLPAEGQDDVIQNIFMKLVKGGLGNFKGTSKYEFLRYFKTIVLNETKSYLASKKGDNRTMSIDEPLFQGPDPDESNPVTLGETIHETKRTAVPGALLEERDLLERVAHILKDEPLLDKQVFLMKVEGYKDEEIKHILQMPLGTVASKFSRIRERIRERLGEEQE